MSSLEKLTALASTTPLYDVHAAWLSDAAGDEQAALSHARAAVQAQPEPWLRLAELAGGILQRAGAKAESQAVYDAYQQNHPGSQLLEPAIAKLKSGEVPAREITDARKGAAEALFDGSGIVGRQSNRDTALALGQLGLFLRPDFPPLQILVGDMLENVERWTDAIRDVSGGRQERSAGDRGTSRQSPAISTDWTGSMRRRRCCDRWRPSAPSTPNRSVNWATCSDGTSGLPKPSPPTIRRWPASGTLQPRHWRLLYARGIALERSKQWPRAEADFLKALEFEPDQPFVLNYLGYSWVEQGQNLERAEAMIRKAVELQPHDGYIIDSLGWVMFRLERYDEAVVHLERAVELRPEDPAINDHLGDAYWAVGRQREARFQWQAALANKPEPELKLAIEQKLSERPLRAASAEPR